MSTSSGTASQRRGSYDHARLERRRRILRWMIDRIAFRFLARVDSVEGVANLPATGPAIVMINHIAFVDPVIVLGVLPRSIVPLAKVEAYRVPVFGLFPWLWEVIPVHRGEIDRKALRSAEDVLRAGEIVLVAPEGTRHPTLQRGKEGIAFLAHRTGAPIVPVAVDGTEGFPSLPILPRWRRPGVRIRVGRPFRFRLQPEKPDRDRLRQMTDQAMGVLAAMLPPARRGVYGDLDRLGQEMLDFG
ncbi:MAG: 1-acyl-sn-glycerol-3-phosphate acyltransferase [Anaerolineales bacterium]|nr:1-acyl-sn-glycerol-3-phosphate acyltransferase [Anaerolineales bacterium]